MRITKGLEVLPTKPAAKSPKEEKEKEKTFIKESFETKLLNSSQDDSKTSTGSRRKRNKGITFTKESLSKQRNQRIRRKPAAFDDYVSYNIAASQKPRHVLKRQAASDTENKGLELPQTLLEPMEPQLRQSPAKIDFEQGKAECKDKKGKYDPCAVSPSGKDDAISNPRTVKNQEASTDVSLQNTNPPSLPSCLLDRGIKIEKIMKLFYVKDELVGLCKYKNCLLMQIVTVEKLKEVDPQALIRAYEPLFWGTQTNK
ncbi:unnamed protein product, partial [Mesorhabditis belari]|uniref:Uncharacterized protein n=1 Tax=Mesorhabditis belari TaxID=2138241 RepID=A0AAF3EBU0_9BILA